MSQALRDARRYEEAREEQISPDERPLFHLSSRVGWMNDPNGFCRYRGKYHIFYQYHPYDSHWGPMHWGHAVSTDLIHWEYRPAALAPDRLYDRDGCYSGNAIALDDGRLLLMYTGMVYEIAEDGSKKELQQQCIAIGDGYDYEKLTENPVLTEKDLPDGGSKYAFRDPKIWQRKDGSFRCLFANNVEGKKGCMLLYKSDDAVHWDFVKIFAENNGRIGEMWECPDFFMLDGKAVLLASAQDMLPKGFEYHSGNGTFYLIGDYDSESETFIEEYDHAVDYGIDFYAPQTVLAPDGRRIMIGWMQNWDTCNLRTASIPWFGQMSIPRELRVKDGILCQQPIREIEALRGELVEYRAVPIADEVRALDGIEGRTIDMEIEVRPTSPAEIYRKFAVRFAKNEKFHTAISFRPQESLLKMDRKFSGSRRAIIHERRVPVKHMDGKLKIRMIMDRYSVEAFLDDGEKAMSMTIETDVSAKDISFFVDGKATISVKKYDLHRLER